LQRILIEPILNTFTQSHGTASKKNKINTYNAKNILYRTINSNVLIAYQHFSKNGDNKAFVDPELTVETKEKLLLQVKRIKKISS
jgi:hypothetical protein